MGYNFSRDVGINISNHKDRGASVFVSCLRDVVVWCQDRWVPLSGLKPDRLAVSVADQ